MKCSDNRVVSIMKAVVFSGAFLILLAGCVKESDINKEITIEGTLLESTSHPVPVSGYILSFYQGGTADNLSSGTIGASSSMAEAQTNANGRFTCHFTLGSGSSTLGFNAGTNDNLISASGERNAGPQLNWQVIPTTSQNLDTVYLYKKVHRAVISVFTSAGLVPTDTLHIIVNTTAGYQNRMVTGLSVPGRGGSAIIDTVPDVIFTKYNVVRHAYYNDMMIVINGDSYHQYKITDDERLPDEDEKTYLVLLR